MSQFETPTIETFANMVDSLVENPFVLQVGAMDGKSFDPVYETIQSHNWHALLVEPIPDIFEKLKKNYEGSTGILFENCAITNKDGHTNMFRMPPSFIEEGREAWAGTSSLFKDRNILSGNSLSEQDKKTVGAAMVKERVRTLTMRSLLAKHSVKRVDVLQIDVEGADWHVLKQFPFDQYTPFIVNVEHYNLPRKERDALMSLLLDLKYELYADEKDVLATKFSR